MPELDELTARLELLWEGTRTGDAKALEDLLKFIILEGRGSLRKYIPTADAPHAARPTEVLQRTAIKIHQKARQGKLLKPKKTALATLGAYVCRTAKEAIRFCKLTGGDLSEPQSITRSDWYQGIPDPAQPIPSRVVPEADLWARRLVRFRQEIERMPEPDRSILRGLRDGKKLIAIATELGLPYDQVRQRSCRGMRHLEELLRDESAA
jgi:DNA-directed RNA polymerase specialized sigma24 family protein